MMNESSTTELKERYTSSFLKTVSAFANYGTGEIIFGVSDDGEVVGIKDTESTRLRIENAINDSLDPCPTYSLDTKTVDGKQIVKLAVHEGANKPYLSAGKAYRRMDTSTVAVDRNELRRLSIEGSEVPYDELKSPQQNLTFKILGRHLKENADIDRINENMLKTLGLLKNGTYNNAAKILADENDFPGTDVARYGDDDELIYERATYEGISVLEQFEETVKVYERNYVVDKIDGTKRKKFEIVPEKAFREALANAYSHRIWYANAKTIVSFYSDRIEVTSPGGLPSDVDEELYLSGGLSVPRNSNLAFVFLRLGMIERLGTGIPRIKHAYENSLCKPIFKVSDKAIKVTLPAIKDEPRLSTTEEKVLKAFTPGLELSSSDVANKTNLSRSTVIRAITALFEKGIITKLGTARSTHYQLT